MTSAVTIYVAATEDIAILDGQVAEVITSAWASSTLSVRNSQWKRFFQFCHTFGLVPLPAEVSTIARFLVHIGQDVRYSTVNNYTSAINCLHKFYGFELDFREYYIIKLVLKGLKTRDVEGFKAKVPFTLDQLDIMCSRTVHSELDELCWLSVVLCMRTLLRKCNVLPSKVEDPHVLKRKDVQILPGLLVFTIYSSKTRHVGDDPLKIPIREIANKRFCVYSNLIKHFSQTTSVSSDSPLIMKTHRGKLSPLMYSDVLQFLKKGAAAINIDPTRVGLHSLRRTGAMHLYSIGVPLNDIRLIGDWKSLAVLLYLSAPFQRLIQVEEMSAASLEKL